MQLISEDKCTGCMACYNACPKSAIKIEQNEKGFYIPRIDQKKCVECGICNKTCPQENPVGKNPVRNVYAAWDKNKAQRLKSSSGGIASLLYELYLQSGVVYGVEFNNNEARFTKVASNTKVKDLRGSKYIQAYVGDIYKDVKASINKGLDVLFIGTPCQIAGLKKYLKESDPSNLLTVDILCHGAPSPKIFKEYADQFNSKIKSVNFRNKDHNWTTFNMEIKFDNNTAYKESKLTDKYMRGFLGDLITNDVCENCQYASQDRVSDITLGDFWGYISETKKYRNTEEGISLVMLNTKKGQEAFERIKDRIEYTSKTIEEASHGNKILIRPFKHSPEYKEFWEYYKENGYKKASEKYFVPTKEGGKRMLSLWTNDHAYLMPNFARELFYRLKGIKHGH